MAKTITYICEDCGKPFPSGKTRSWALYCAKCIAPRRAEGRGPFQQRR